MHRCHVCNVFNSNYLLGRMCLMFIYLSYQMHLNPVNKLLRNCVVPCSCVCLFLMRFTCEYWHIVHRTTRFSNPFWSKPRRQLNSSAQIVPIRLSKIGMMTSSNHANGNIFRVTMVTGLLWEAPPVTGGFPSQRPVTRSFDVFFDLRLNKRLVKQSRRRWFGTPSRSLWRQCNKWRECWYLIQKLNSLRPLLIHWHPVKFIYVSELAITGSRNGFTPVYANYHTRPCAYQWFQGCACKVCETHRLKVKWQKRTG